MVYINVLLGGGERKLVGGLVAAFFRSVWLAVDLNRVADLLPISHSDFSIQHQHLILQDSVPYCFGLLTVDV